MYGVHVLVLVLWVRADGNELFGFELAQMLAYSLLGSKAALCGECLNADIRWSGCDVMISGTLSLTEEYGIDEMVKQGHIDDFESGCCLLLDKLPSVSLGQNCLPFR